MSSKIINVILVCLFTLCIAGKANAGIIDGEFGHLYADSDGVQWEYIGYYDLVPEYGRYVRASELEIMQCADDITCIENLTLIPVFNGIEVATYLFGELSVDQEYAISTKQFRDNVGYEYLVDHKAWYAQYDGDTYSKNESYHEDSLYYNSAGVYSAYTHDQVGSGVKINHVFKSVTISVPEPSTLAIFSLALMGLTARRFKNK
jgi:hypothetical protein